MKISPLIKFFLFILLLIFIYVGYNILKIYSESERITSSKNQEFDIFSELIEDTLKIDSVDYYKSYLRDEELFFSIYKKSDSLCISVYELGKVSSMKLKDMLHVDEMDSLSALKLPTYDVFPMFDCTDSPMYDKEFFKERNGEIDDLSIDIDSRSIEVKYMYDNLVKIYGELKFVHLYLNLSKVLAFSELESLTSIYIYLDEKTHNLFYIRVTPLKYKN